MKLINAFYCLMDWLTGSSFWAQVKMFTLFFNPLKGTLVSCLMKAFPSITYLIYLYVGTFLRLYFPLLFFPSETPLIRAHLSCRPL
jgi:hypothetical protein